MVKQTIIYVKCCADWFVCLSVFLFIAFVSFLFAKFIHLCCATTYDGKIKLYNYKRTGCDVWQLECQASNVSASV